MSNLVSIQDVMELSDYQSLLSSYLAGETSLTDQQKFDFVDVWMNYKGDCGESVFPVDTIRAFAVELNLVYNGRDAVDFIH